MGVSLVKLVVVATKYTDVKEKLTIIQK